MIRIEDLYQLFLKHPHVSTDTRSIKDGAIFFCLKGAQFDGNTFAMQAYEAGASYILIDDPEYLSVPQTILVDDVLLALQNLAAFHRMQFSIPVIGITGTNGKTTTKELMHAVLSTSYKVTATKGNLNNHIGVPLTLLAITADTEIAIIEMGANHPGEIEALCKLAKPTAGIITNVGNAHLEGFGSLENIIETKTALYRSVAERQGWVWVSALQENLLDLVGGMNYQIYGAHADSSCPGQLISADPFIEVAWGPGCSNVVKTKLAGSWNYENILAAACIGLYYNVDANLINRALTEYEPSNMRSQVLTRGSNTLILDAYNANPSSMKLALDHFISLSGKNKTLILGDMRELGSEATREHLRILDWIRKMKFEKVILVGPVFSSVATDTSFIHFSNTGEAAHYLQNHPVSNALILIKGSRGIGLETLVEHIKDA